MGFLTWDDIFLVEFTTEHFLGDELEALHGVFDNFVVPLFVQAKLVDEVLLEDAVEERASTDPARAHCRLLDLQYWLES